MYLFVVFRFFLVVDFRFLVVFLCLETEPTEMHQSLKVEKYILSKPTTYFSNSTQLPKELTCKIVLWMVALIRTFSMVLGKESSIP